MATGLFVLILVIVGLVTLDLLALRFGADSRPREGRFTWW
jgi:hypothetical protein